MANAFVIISLTDDPNDGKKFGILGGTWHPNKPAPDSGHGLAGDGWRSIGAAGLKYTVDFTGRYQKVGLVSAPGDKPDWASKSDVDAWAAPTTQAGTQLRVWDTEGTKRNMRWVSPWLYDSDTNESAGNAEWYEIKVRLIEK